MDVGAGVLTEGGVVEGGNGTQGFAAPTAGGPAVLVLLRPG